MRGRGAGASLPSREMDLAGALEGALSSYFRRPCRLAALQRRPYVYSTSFALEELDVQLHDGTALHLLFKDLSRARMLAEAHGSKPAYLYDPLREIETYRAILPHEELGTARCYGTMDGANGHGLFLEKVPGRELYQVGDAAVWCDVAGWLAGMHDRFGPRVEELQQSHRHLLRYDADFYRQWLHRARSAAGVGPSAPRTNHSLNKVAAGLEDALERLGTMPVTFLHGELYASNVLVAEEVAGRRVCAVDWEMAGLGPGLLDVAALCSGWDPDTRQALALAYRDTLTPRSGWPPGEREFLDLLDCCSLCVAVQWLGWSPGWSAPPQHAQDWLGQAVLLVEGLGL